jgi:hypothetical protein
MCPLGSYQSQEGTAKCFKCQKNTYGVLEGQVSPIDCLRCPSGHFSAVEGGTIADCETSPANTYERINRCLVCPPNTISDPGSRTCHGCVGAMGIDAESGKCEHCPSGSFAIDGLPCMPCPKGNYGTGKGLELCSPCSPGTYAPEEGATSCKLCPKGLCSFVLGSFECKPCPTNNPFG